MLHQPILAFNKNLNLLNENIFFKILFLIILILLSTISWKYIEQPFRNFKKVSNKSFLLIASLIIIIIIVFNLTVILTRGFISNYKIEDRHLALLNPLTEGRYVSKEFNKLKKNEFKKISTKNILILGDSHAQDFVNMAHENNFFKGYNLKTETFHIECYAKFLKSKNITIKSKSQKCSTKISRSIEYADTIFFVNVWEDWRIDNFKEIFDKKNLQNKNIKILVIQSLIINKR